VLPPDYDSDPGRWGSWESPQDVHDIVAPELSGPVLDVGCGEGRLASVLDDSITWIGVDSSPAQLANNPFRPIVRADMAALPFRDDSFAEVSHLWCLYHLEDPFVAVAEAWRVLQPGAVTTHAPQLETTILRSCPRATPRARLMPWTRYQ
jgi:ubiquinone/menaquinone biosynthesis C-methylase UbiE